MFDIYVYICVYMYIYVYIYTHFIFKIYGFLNLKVKITERGETELPFGGLVSKWLGLG